MKLLMKNIKENKNNYLIIFLILLSLYGIFSLNRYATDTYSFEAYGMGNNAINPYFHDGRLIMTLFLYILDFLKVPYTIAKLISWMFAFSSLYLSSLLFYNIVQKHCKNKFLNIFLSVSIVANPFVVEYFIFTEYSGITCLGILFVFTSIFLIINYWENSKKSNLLLAYIFTIFSVMCYQGVISLLFIIPLVFILKYAKDFKDFVKKLFEVGFAFLIPAIVTAILTKFLGASRLATEFNLLEKIKNVFSGVITLLTTTFKLLPEYFLLVAFIFSLIMCFINLRKKKENILHLIFVFICLFIAPALPHIFTSDIWMVPRSNLGYGIIIATPILLYLLYGKHNKKVDNVFIVFMCLILVLQLRTCLTLAKDQFKNNVLASEEVNKIDEYIDRYEKENNIEVTKYRLYFDKTTTYCYSDIKCAEDINVRALSYEWSYDSVLKIKSQKNLEKVETDNKEIKSYCKENDWEKFNYDQLKIVNDTIYICNY